MPAIHKQSTEKIHTEQKSMPKQEKISKTINFNYKKEN